MTATSMSGPLFSGLLDRVTATAVDVAERELADEAKAAVDRNLSGSLQEPTGFYQSRIDVEADGTDLAVTDGGVVYGPWLEGVGERNRTTAFKGYASFRRAAQAVDARAAGIVERAVAPQIRSVS